jgi:hypothetical protein
MACENFKPVYAPQKMGGLNLAASRSDGNQIALEWDKAYPSIFGNKIVYNIYFSTVRYDIIDEGVKYASIDETYLNTCITDLPPGQMYFFIVRAAEYNPEWYDLSQLEDGPDGLKIYTEGILLSNISDTDTEIPVSDISQWPSYGVIQVGTELIRYSSKDVPNNTLIVSERGFGSTNVRLHNTDGYDGVDFRDPVVKFFKSYEDDNFRVQTETSTFFQPNAAFTFADGYATKTDKLTGDFTSTDSNLEEFPRYDQVGWHRTDPRKLVKGQCIGTYIGGEQWCADGYLGVGRQTRGVPLSEQALRREELLLESIGQQYVLVKRLWEGIRCPCVISTNEQPNYRCHKCFGTSFVTGYNQYFSPRRSDGRILMRPGPYPDDLKFYDAGLESEAILELWTLPVPTIKVKDFLIRYNRDGIEEFRYEVIQVIRNLLFDEVLGVQKIRAQRVRKTSPIYQWRAIASTATMPTKVTTSIGMLRGPNGTMIPHTHEIVINEGIVSLGQINQTTSVIEGHNHVVKDGIVLEEFGHSHTIIL